MFIRIFKKLLPENAGIAFQVSFKNLLLCFLRKMEFLRCTNRKIVSFTLITAV